MERDVCIDKQSIEIPKILVLREHMKFKDVHIDGILNLNIPFCKTKYEGSPKYLGIQQDTLSASYYIGADWLTEEHAIVVTPKVDNLDFIEMYMCALKFDLASDYFSKFYCIDFDKKCINTNALENQLTPLIIIHYISLLKSLAKCGLKKGYVIREENLKSKVKGKIKISQNLRLNSLQKRDDRVYCQFQEYTIDNLENRLLKKALIFTKSFIKVLSKHSSYTSLHTMVNSLFTTFSDVSDDIEVSTLKQIKPNKLYKEHTEAIRVAKMILRRFNYSITETNTVNKTTPVFWIDMSRLYEVYVYTKLYEAYGDLVKFQVSGYMRTAVDFIKSDESLIIDTKYKPKYDGSNEGIINDIRQLSAYARDRKILKELNCDNITVPPCLIIYPEKVIDNTIQENNEPEDKCTELDSFLKHKSILEQASDVKNYLSFYKLSIPLPQIRKGEYKNGDRIMSE